MTTIMSDGIEGGLKVRPEDFVVAEVASYEPAGKGTHLWLRLEKRGLSTRAAIGRLGQVLDLAPRLFGYAGQKDARAVTSQWVSIEHPPADAFERLQDLEGTAEELTEQRPLVISAQVWHKNRLGLGHLFGNRFRIRMRGVAPEVAAGIEARLDELVRCGAPNAFGRQRFGHRGDSGAIGGALLKRDFAGAVERILGRTSERDTGRIREPRELFDAGDFAGALGAWPRDFALERRLLGKLVAGLDAEAAIGSADKRDLDFFRAAFQSELFNAVLERRRAQPGGLGILDGELAMRLPIARKAFVVEDLELERARRKELEISPTGPLFGTKMPQPGGAAAEPESAVLVARGLELADFEGGLPGGRRALVMRVTEASSAVGTDDHGDFVELTFMLPKGCYATSLIDALWYSAKP